MFWEHYRVINSKMYITIIDWLELIMICLCHMCFWLLYFYREKAYLTDWQMAAFDINSDNILLRLVYFTKHGNIKTYVVIIDLKYHNRSNTYNLSKFINSLIQNSTKLIYIIWLLIQVSTFLINNSVIYLTYNVTSIYECFACTLTNGYLID